MAKVSRSSSTFNSSSEGNLSVSGRSNGSLRVAEKKRRKNEAEDPLLLALKYFSEGRACSVNNMQYSS